MAFGMTTFGNVIVRYLGLFRPAKNQLTFSRVNTLLRQLLPMIEEARIEWKGRSYSAPQEYFRTAMEDMLARRDKLTLPLDSHGYLLSIIASSANQAEARQEAKAEESKRHRPADLSADGGKVIRSRPPRKLGDVLANLNKRSTHSTTESE